jgi:hypothetical protein
MTWSAAFASWKDRRKRSESLLTLDPGGKRLYAPPPVYPG